MTALRDAILDSSDRSVEGGLYQHFLQVFKEKSKHP